IYRSPAGLLKTVVSVWPPGSKVYLGESVLLKCAVESNSTAQWGFEHVVSNDSYFITAVTREDAGSYRCKAGQTSSQPVELIVSGEQLQHLLSCSPNHKLETVLVMFVLFAIIDWVSHISE
uniref:Ig-like domain-containing protein n=1 Tax=Maylandia zebra TaxID=106582 RepID=A0A3P9DJF5_9CICH